LKSPKSFIMNKLYIIFSLLIFSNCKEGVPQYLGNTTPLFDLKGFLDNEIATHLKDVKTVKKTVTVNGKTETKEVAIKDWKEELKPFFNSDINRPAWRDKYKVLNLNQDKDYDTIFFNKQYDALDKNLKTQRIELGFGVEYKVIVDKYMNRIDTIAQMQASQVSVFNTGNSGINQSYQLLSYDQNGYTIISKQKLIGTNEDKIKIEVFFSKNASLNSTRDLETLFADLIPQTNLQVTKY
jgi:hypothetical protein